jgi:hypothetical protein
VPCSILAVSRGGPSGAHILAQHPGILIFENAIVIDKGVFWRRLVIKGNQKLSQLLAVMTI